MRSDHRPEIGRFFLHIVASAALVVLLLVVPAQTATAAGVADCGPDIGATPVPQFRAETFGASLWPLDPGSGRILFQPASGIPHTRDSTNWDTRTPPQAARGTELFYDVAAVGGRSDDVGGGPIDPLLFTLYTNGVIAWDLGSDPASPAKLRTIDLWQGHWFSLMADGEVDQFLYGLDVVALGDSYLIATAGRSGVGVAFWTFETTLNTFTQVYQSTQVEAYMIRLVERPDGIYALAATQKGVEVYDVDAALAAAPCFDQPMMPACPQVKLGKLGTMTSGRYVDTIEVGGQLYVAAADGFAGGAMKTEIWRLDDPSMPAQFPAGSAVELFDGLTDASHSPTFLSYGGSTYLAAVDGTQMKVFELDTCLPAGCGALPAPSAIEDLVSIVSVSKILSLSWSRGVPYLYYGVDTIRAVSSGIDRLWRLGGLPAVHAPNALPEVTDGGASYADPCNGALQVDYWGDYYPRNDYGLNRFMPLRGLFRGEYFYRAGNSIFDVHRLSSVEIFTDGFESGNCTRWDGGTGCS